MIKQLIVIFILAQLILCKKSGFKQQSKKSCYNKCHITDCFVGENDDTAFMKCIKSNLKCSHKSSLCDNYECFNECKQQAQYFQLCYKCLNECNSVVDECKINEEAENLKTTIISRFTYFQNVFFNGRQSLDKPFLEDTRDTAVGFFIELIQTLLIYAIIILFLLLCLFICGQR